MALVLGAACSQPKGNGADPDPVCQPSGPAFHLQIGVDGGPLPENLSVTARYQGNLEETFSLSTRHRNEDLCCRRGTWREGPLVETSCSPAPLDAGLGDAVHCTLWSNGAATVTLTARGYGELNTPLVATLDEVCDVVLTSEVNLVLQRADASVGQTQ